MNDTAMVCTDSGLVGVKNLQSPAHFSMIVSDLYTFDTSEEKARLTYAQVCQAYEKLFNRLGLKSVKGDLFAF